MQRRLAETITSHVPFERARELLATDPASLIADDRVAAATGRCHATLTLALAGGSSASQEVEVGLGSVEARADEARLPLTWEPVAHGRALPSFEGALVVRRDPSGATLSLEGAYQPPFGALGAFGDGVVGHRVARSCATRLLARLEDRVRHAAAGTVVSPHLRPAPYAIDLRPTAAPRHQPQV